MREVIISIVLLLPLALFSQNESRFSFNTGITYNQQYPNGTYIGNYWLPNIEAGLQYRILASHLLGMKPEIGISTHNFGLTRYSDDYTKTYFRFAPYAGFNLLADFDKDDEGRVFQSFWCGTRLEFYNRFSSNAFFNAGLGFHIGKYDLYLKWSKSLFYTFPDQDLWAKPVDMDDYYYPLGNERWSITAGVVWKVFGKNE